MARNESDIDLLVDSATSGDRRAVNALLAIIRPLVVRYVRKRVSTERAGVSADDVAQEVCVAVLRALPSYSSQGRPFLAFVYGIAASKVVDTHRAVARDRSIPTASLPEEAFPGTSPEQAAISVIDSAEMRQLLDMLPPKQRDILVLRVVVGLSAEETAEAVGSTPGAVRVAQHRAMVRLREFLAEFPDASSRERVLGSSMVHGSQPWTGGSGYGDELGAGALVDQVLEDSITSTATLTDDILEDNPKEFFVYNSFIDLIKSLVNVDEAVDEAVDHYRHRQLSTDIEQELGSRITSAIGELRTMSRTNGDASDS